MTENEFFDGLEKLIRETAQTSDFLRFKGATITQVDLVVELQQVSRVLTEHCRDVLTHGQGRWAEVAAMLAAAARACHNEVRVDAPE
jgi:hypothetical protein